MINEQIQNNAIRQWEDLFRTPSVKSSISQMVLGYPESRSLYIDYRTISDFNLKFACFVLDHAEDAIAAGNKALIESLPPDIKTRTDCNAHLRIKNVKFAQSIAPGDIRDVHLGKMYSVCGRIKKAQGVRRKFTLARWQCQRCGTITEIAVPEEDMTLPEPLACDQENGGCGSPLGRTRFTLVRTLCKRVDFQAIHLEDDPNLMRGNQPESIRCFLWDDIVGAVPCNQARINGIIKLRVNKNSKQSAIAETYLEALSIEADDQKSPVVISKGDEEAILKIAHGKDPFNLLRASMAPSIFGHEMIKESMILGMIGGVSKVLPDGNTKRGQIHHLIVGDPGVAKTALLKAATDLAPIGLYGSGEGSTGAGLTFTFVRDEFDGQWAVDAGLLPMCDGGCVFFDELDKIDKDELKRLHTALETQELPFAKAGLVGTMRARITLMAGANPKSGKFDTFRLLPEQIDITPPLLSRFDVVFTIADTPDDKKDEDIARHVLKAHRVNAEGLPRAPIDKEILRKFIAYVQRFRPELTPQQEDRLNKTYVSMRKRIDGTPTNITVRQLDAMVRLSEASARVRASTMIIDSDIDRAIAIITYFLSQSSSDDGSIDFSIMTTGLSTSQRDRIWTILEVMKNTQGQIGVTMDDIQTILGEREYPMAKFNEDFDRLKRDGRIFERIDGHWKTTD